MTEAVDKEVLTRAAAGDAEAFRQVVETTQRLVYNLAYRYVYDRAAADDMAQECFVRLYNKLGQYDAERPFRPWLMRLVTNTCLNWLRREKRHQRDATALDEEAAALAGNSRSRPAADPAEAAAAREAREQVRQAVSELPAEYKSAIGLRYFEGMEYAEIADVLSVPLGTVKIRLFRAREVLKRKLGRLVRAELV